ncbi:hypothetical protein JYK02_37360 [Corallococcus macrosporus]|uniref:N-acetyltransferase domain-containing protein n=1 Tax=Corallococcus macrosporus TaxID=35 RepID=A0ABS3DPK6_9BACT|nr:hypothetical protein [Corallococcus macrosporus]MBN8233198.1 hypothetical protein [Corallococcus macrosporus]
MNANAPRFDMDATDLEGAFRYFENRAVQALMDGHAWTGLVTPLSDERGTVWGARTTCRDAEGTLRQSVYVLASHRGQGHLSRYVAATDLPFVTGPHSHLEAFFTKRGVPYSVSGRFTTTREYRVIERHYGSRRAVRSGVDYMCHIDEGLGVLRHFNASDAARRAWCLHPLVQADGDLAESFPRLHELTDSPQVLALAMEYRNIANAYLSHREVTSADDLALGPLPDVADMLRADKVQNYKDFLLHHRESHPRRSVLDRYFRLWLDRLDVSREVFATLFARLQVRPEKVPLRG